jgi:hypothetical protein
LENSGNTSINLVRTSYWEEYTDREVEAMFRNVLNKEVQIIFIGGEPCTLLKDQMVSENLL